MKSETESNHLLDELFDELTSPAFRAELLEQTLAEARHTKNARRRNRTILTMAGVALAGLLAWRMELPRNVPEHAPLTGLAVVRSVPLAASEIVESIPGSAHVIGSTSSTIAFVKTQSSVPELNDAQLLALMDGTPSVLIRKGPHDEELLVVDASTSTARPVDDTYRRDIPNQ